jgi:hypothetical protein
MGGATLDFKYESNGTFEVSYQGQTSTGAYLVAEGYQVTYADFDGGVGVYTYEVIDNNTISVTEGEFAEDGSFVTGNTTLFRRKAGSTVIKTNTPTMLSKPYNADNNMSGAWKAFLPYEDGVTPGTYPTVQAYDTYGGMVIYGDMQAYGVSLGMQCYYSAIGDIVVMLALSDMGSGAEAFQYTTETNGSLMVTPITSVDQNGVRTLDTGATAEFMPIW